MKSQLNLWFIVLFIFLCMSIHSYAQYTIFPKRRIENINLTEVISAIDDYFQGSQTDAESVYKLIDVYLEDGFLVNQSYEDSFRDWTTWPRSSCVKYITGPYYRDSVKNPQPYRPVEFGSLAQRQYKTY